MSKLKVNDVIKVDVNKIVSEGKGLAYFDKRAIFVNRGLPGDCVDVVIKTKKKSYYLANITHFHKKSDFRSDSECSHFPICGGCQYMDVSYSNQLQLKKEMLLDVIHQFYPELKSVLSDIIPSKEVIFYRNKMEFSFSSNKEGIICGLKKRHTFDEVIPVNNCLLQDKQTSFLLDSIVTYMKENNINDCASDQDNSFLKHVMVRHSKKHNQFMINLFITEKNESFFKDFVSYLQQQNPALVSAHLTYHDQKIGHPTTQTILSSIGDSHLVESLDWLNCHISPLSFFQTNSTQALVLYDTIKSVADLKASDRILDLYCGTGTIGLFLSQHVNHVIGIEENPYAIEDAKLNTKKNNIKNIEYRCGRVKNILKFESFDVDCVIVDPPRSGMVPKALKRLCDLKCKKIIYVSCHPVTLLRDLKEFQKHNYKISTFIPVDMFPNTFHIESVVKLELN